MILHFFGKRKRLLDQPGDALLSRVVEPLAMIRFADLFRDRLGSCRRDHAFLPLRLIRIDYRLLPVDRRQVRPQLLRAVATASPHVKGNNLAG
jgi:hypothetical protein